MHYFPWYIDLFFMILGLLSMWQFWIALGLVTFVIGYIKYKSVDKQ